MIQRIQTVFLVLVVVLLGAAMFLPTFAGNVQELTLFGLKKVVAGKEIQSEFMPYGIAGILASVSLLIAIAEIVSFKNRVLQLKLGLFNSLLLLINMAGSFYFAYSLKAEVLGVKMELGPKLGIFLLMGAVVLNQLASKFIRKDDNLVKSVDRIR
ncbi:DUF4293 domain-containing protein [Aureibacter tunicatorum]|uniref:DUF4293 family protein n=1 Tax=Aureibacter tunicatorum TaxID=866807 RepID=A0AAE4BS06_9BACT|nr:DUF4293 domain-containing protein [Aureibacter tunicatorum]MDR6238390.1 hypothetical protein [Aureibacter tunicatorum]BDD03422.1 membrane protein [Aureibacter tunicatorum]